MDMEKIISELIENQAVSFIGSVDSEGYPNIRCMLRPRKKDGIHTIYFSTNTSTNKIKHFELTRKSCVYFYNLKTFQGAMLKGEMEVLSDSKSKEMLWERGDEIYYKGGVTDPDYCVLRFTAKMCRYYSNFISIDFKI